jgi:hypothetical protein
MTTTDLQPAVTYQEHTPRIWPAWMPWLVGAITAALIIGIGSWLVYGRDTVPASMGTADEPQPPAVAGFYDGKDIEFLHTEASEAQVADMLTTMMGSPVIVVPSLADVPANARGAVYVFTNGVRPDGDAGPFGFQPDVFDSVPGDPGYTPLRSVRLVTWSPEATPQVLRSSDQITAAQAAGQVEIEQASVVVNMPIIRWPDGQR